MSRAYHLSNAVVDFSTAKKFYDPLFEKLGWQKKFEAEEVTAYTDGSFDFWLIPADKPEKIRTTEGAGLSHFAIKADRREDVDEIFTWLKTTKAQIDIEPQAYPEYTENYYAVFFYDPEGVRLEVVFN